MNASIPEIKARLGTVRDVLGDHKITLQGNSFRCISPDHEDQHPSAYLTQGGDRFACGACDCHGDVIDAWAILRGMTASEAIPQLAELFGLNGSNPRPTTRRKQKPTPTTETEKLGSEFPQTARALGHGTDVTVLAREMNYTKEKDDEGNPHPVPRPFNETLDRIMDMAQGRLLRCGYLFAMPSVPGGDLRLLKSAPDLFSWLGEHCQTSIDWKPQLTGAMSKPEAFSGVFERAVRYDGIEAAPHYPEMPRLFYNHPELPEPDQGAFDDLLDMFKPDTDHDRALIAAMFLTAFWGGPLGQRPAFIITSPDGCGAGKSTLADMAAHLVGQEAISGSSKQDIEKLKTRLLSPEGLSSRVVSFDNETGRVSNGELAALITSPFISGHRMYAGEGRRPNNLLWVVTLNTPSLDSDLASRGIPIVIRKPDYSAEWRREILDHIDHHRWEIISALIALLKMPSLPVHASTRWGGWENEVLAKVRKWAPEQDIDGLIEVYTERQREFDDEANEVELIRDEFVRAIDQAEIDIELKIVFVPNGYAASLYNEATGARVRKNTALRCIGNLIRTEALPEMEKAKHGSHGRGFYWTSNTVPEGAEIEALHPPEWVNE